MSRIVVMAAVTFQEAVRQQLEITCDRVAFIKAGAVIAIRDMASLATDSCRFLLRARGWMKLVLPRKDAAPAVVRFVQIVGTDEGL